MKVVRVRWLDSHTELGWVSPPDLRVDLSVDSVGFLVVAAPDRITLAGGQATGGARSFHCPLTIPTSSILDVAVLEEAKEPPAPDEEQAADDASLEESREGLDGGDGEGKEPGDESPT